MTTKPQLKLGPYLVPGLATAALSVAMAVVFLDASSPNPQGFPGGASIIVSIGYSMFNLGFGSVDGESMLVVSEIVGPVLIAILAGAMLLAHRRDTTGQIRTILTDGGWELRQTLFDDKGGDN